MVAWRANTDTAGPRHTPPRSLCAFTKVLVVVVCLSAAAQHWYLGRILGLENFLSSGEHFALTVLPRFMSGAIGGPGRHIGEEDPGQVARFRAQGGLLPGSRLDIRDVPGDGSTGLVWEVYPGIMWVWYAVSQLGWRLDVASLAHAQTCADFASLGLAIALGWRLAGAYAGALVGLLYAWSAPVEAGVLVIAYYPWSIAGGLVAGHLLLSAMVSRASSFWVLAYSAFAAALVWLRSLWLPVGLGLLALPTTLRRPKWGRIVLLVGAAVIIGGFGATATRVRSAGVGDGTLLPRAEIWQTLYIGLGWYGNFGPIQWRDGYAREVGAKAGFPRARYGEYEAYMRRLFVEEIRSAPLKYVTTLLRRFVDYLRAGWLGWGPPWVPSVCVVGALGAVVTVLVLGDGRMKRRFLGPTALYLSTIAVWSILLPPQESYALETLGLVYPVFGNATVASIALVAPGAGHLWAPRGNDGVSQDHRRWIDRLPVPLMSAGALILGLIGAGEWWQSAALHRASVHALTFHRVDTSRPATSDETFPPTAAEYLLASDPLRKSAGADTLVVQGAPTVLAGRAGIGVLDVRRDRWASFIPLSGQTRMLNLASLAEGAQFRVLITGANAQRVVVRLGIQPTTIIQERRGVPAWLSFSLASALMGAVAVLAARNRTR